MGVTDGPAVIEGKLVSRKIVAQRLMKVLVIFVIGAVEVKEISGVEGDITFSEQDDGQGVGFGFVEALVAAAAEGEVFEDLLEPGEAVVAGAKDGVERFLV